MEGYNAIGLSRRSDERKRQIFRIEDYADYNPSKNAILVHLAQTRDVRRAEEKGQSHIDETVALCKALQEKPWMHLIYASSAEIYGDQVPAARCTCEPVAPQSAYGTVRQQCEKLILEKNGTVLRLANVYGSGMADNNVLSVILSQIPGAGPLRVNDSAPVRDFIWIEDVISAFMSAIELRRPGIFNIGSGRGASIADLAEYALKLAGQEHRPVQDVRASGKPSHLVLDIEETRQALNWTPTVTIEKGISKLMGINS